MRNDNVSIDKQVLACYRERMTRTQRLPTAQRRRQIAEAALRIISTQGVHRLTAVALADRVGIADGTIFRHFSNKEEIVNTAIDLFQATLEGTFPPEDREPLERLRLFFVNRLTLARENPDFLRLAFNDRLAEAAGEVGAKRVAQLVERSVAFVHKCLAEAQERAEITRDTPSILLTWMVIGVIRGASTRGPFHVPGTKDPSSTSPKKLWKELESLLRSTTPETTE